MVRFLECHAHVRKRGPHFERIPTRIRWFRCAMKGFNTIIHYLCWYKKDRPGSGSRAIVRSSSNAALDTEDTAREMVVLPKKMNTARIPNEIYDAILGFLPHSSLYILRQTSRGFRQYIDNDPVFRKFQSLSRWHRTVPAAVRDSREIYASLRRETLCTECRAISTEELRERLISLCEPGWCTGCKKHHPGIFFPANGVKRNKCVGLLGHFDVCSHRRLNFQWRLPKPWVRYLTYDRCMDKSHASLERSDANPDLISQQCIPTIEVDTCKYPCIIATTTSLTFEIRGPRERKSTTRDIMRGVLRDCGHLCPHSSAAMESLLNNLECTLCCCNYFPKSIPARDDGCVSPCYTCLECNITYVWERQSRKSKRNCKSRGLLSENSFRLHISRRWRYLDPLSFEWLRSIQYGDGENPVLTDRTKHVLWCDQPDCGTGSGHRWLKLVKLFSHVFGYNQCSDLKTSGFGYHCGTHTVSFPRACSWSLEYDVYEEARKRYPEEKRGSLDSWCEFFSVRAH